MAEWSGRFPARSQRLLSIPIGVIGVVIHFERAPDRYAQKRRGPPSQSCSLLGRANEARVQSSHMEWYRLLLAVDAVSAVPRLGFPS